MRSQLLKAVGALFFIAVMQIHGGTSVRAFGCPPEDCSFYSDECYSFGPNSSFYYTDSWYDNDGCLNEDFECDWPPNQNFTGTCHDI
jgi:hypothetical protein